MDVANTKSTPSRRGLLWLLLGLALVPLMPSNQSLWIDEWFSVQYAQEDSFSAFVSRLEADQGSDALMPLGVFATWLEAKLFGLSELGLRVASAAWGAVAIFLLWRVGTLVGVVWLPALLACHPFLWYYAGEARPYAMAIAMSSGVLYALVAIVSSNVYRERGLIALSVFGPLLCATYVLGVLPFTVVSGIVALTLIRGKWRPHPPVFTALMLSCGVLIVLASYYLHVIVGGADINLGGPFKVSLGNLAFAGYELLGFIGFGPGRYALRQHALEGGISGALGSLFHWAGVGLVVLALLYAHMAWRLLKRAHVRICLSDRLALLSGLTTVLAAGAVFILCLAAGSKFWGRHLASLLPFLIFAFGIAARDGQSRPAGSLARRLPLLLGATLLASSLLVRFDPQHRRDDYRGASRIACASMLEGDTVWWVADAGVALYYSVHFGESDPVDGAGRIIPVMNRADGELDALPRPSVILVSKPDLHDRTNAVQNYIAEQRFRLSRHLMAFEIYEPP